ncbi:MAG: T9SS type A sorting domain-containing protein, partial [Ekhidna sp.]|nr:T9SS type A sorting domain-containing protein [Ekhidna sp.]
TDEAGNSSEQTQTVTIDDTEAPRVTGSLTTVTAQCPINAENELTKPDAPADNCKGTVNVALKSGTNFPIQAGTTTITWVYTDESGNTSEQMQEVIIDDTKAPVPDKENLMPFSACSQVSRADLNAPTAMDNCDGTLTAEADASFPITESGTVTWTYTDKTDNTAEQMQEVVVSDDVLLPNVTSLLPINAQCEVASLNAPTARNCAGNTLTATPDVVPPIMASTTITWTYTDGSKTATQTQEVTIVADTEAPTVAGTLDAITARCSLAEADVTAPKANDVCDGQITATTNATFPITSKTTITWTFTDKADNTATQTQAVTITPCVLSVADDALEAVVFPNPSGRYVEVQSPVESPIRILSVGGELVLKSTTNTRIDAASLRSGLYLIQLPDGHLLKFVKK